MLDYGLPQKEKKTVVRGNVGAAATGLLQPTRLAVELIYIYIKIDLKL